MDNEYSLLEDSVRNTFGSVLWSHKIQEKQADIYFSQYKCMETIKIETASLTSVGNVSLIFTDQMWLKVLSALVLSIMQWVDGDGLNQEVLLLRLVEHMKMFY